MDRRETNVKALRAADILGYSSKPYGKEKKNVCSISIKDYYNFNSHVK